VGTTGRSIFGDFCTPLKVLWHLSLTAPGIVGWEESDRREMARRVNEYTADLVARRSDRFEPVTNPIQGQVNLSIVEEVRA
jgi:hypothetical protein